MTMEYLFKELQSLLRRHSEPLRGGDRRLWSVACSRSVTVDVRDRQR